MAGRTREKENGAMGAFLLQQVVRVYSEKNINHLKLSRKP